jgi:hypothetical protein
MTRLVLLTLAIVVIIALFVPGLPEMVRDFVNRLMSVLGLG